MPLASIKRKPHGQIRTHNRPQNILEHIHRSGAEMPLTLHHHLNTFAHLAHSIVSDILTKQKNV